MSDSDIEELNQPCAEECDKRCKEFASITQTDTVLAKFFLQDRDWNLETSLSDYFQSVEMEMRQGGASAATANPSFKNRTSKSNLLNEEKSKKDFVDSEPNRIRLMSWNIDGLDQNNVKTRAKAVCKTINREKPDVVYLQEVTLNNLEVIKEMCTDYLVTLGTERNLQYSGEYFTAILLRKMTVTYIDHDIHSFASSVMSRTLLQVEAKVKGIPFQLMTSHLESTIKMQAERLKQLKFALEAASEVPEDRVVVFGGDLNVRDAELEKVGGLRNGFIDLWEETGRRPEARYTWDMMKNDNIEMTQRNKPRQRFDRLICRTGGKVKPVYFELVGFERIEGCRRFPSDHWGIMAHFDKVLAEISSDKQKD